MSFDIASHPGRTGTDELVPSRYALRVGEIDVLVISDGPFPLPATTLATNVDPADTLTDRHWLQSGSAGARRRPRSGRDDRARDRKEAMELLLGLCAELGCRLGRPEFD